jgi:uncharacterized protein (DUF488 family)
MGWDSSLPEPFFTIGHSTRPIAEFIDLLRHAGVWLVVDVRTIPRSLSKDLPHAWMEQPRFLGFAA